MARRSPLDTGVIDSVSIMAAIERSLAHAEDRGVVVVELERIGDPRTWTAAWDSVLTAAEARMVHVLRPDDVLGRLEDGRFAVLTGNDGAARVALRLAARLREPFDIAKERVVVAPLVGVGYPKPGVHTAAALIQAATSSLRYEA